MNEADTCGKQLVPYFRRPAGTTSRIPYPRQLTSANGDDRRDVIATVFRGVDNRMKSGYLLRDVISKIAGIHFTSSEELHILGALYESLLREMWDAAGDSGEFYTLRPGVRFMVAMTDPRLGETVLDPASGTGGLLVEAFNHLSETVSRNSEVTALAEALSLPWSHYVLLVRRTRSAQALDFYHAEALRGGWSVRQLDRQIASQFYERTALSNWGRCYGRLIARRPLT